MDTNLIDPNNSSGEDTTHNLSALSNVESPLKKCEVHIIFIRDSRLNDSEIHVIHKKVRKMLSVTTIVADNISAMATSSYTKLSDFNSRLNYLKQIAVSQQQQVLDHKLILDPTDSSF